MRRPKTAADPIGNPIGDFIRDSLHEYAPKAGDEIPIEFIISNLGTQDYKYENRTYDRSGRMNEYQLSAKQADGGVPSRPAPELPDGYGGRRVPI